MYKTIYKDMAACGAAEKLDKEVLVNYNRKTVTGKNKGDSLPTQYLLHKPELILFVDKTGSNTNQKSDPLQGNKKRIVGTNGDGFGISGSISGNNFTVMCFQSGTGEPAMLAIIFKSDNKMRDVPLHWETGIDICKLRHKVVLPG
jgi:hypothetical protein